MYQSQTIEDYTMDGQIPVAIGNYGGCGLKLWCAVGMLASGPTLFRYFLNKFHSFVEFEIQNKCFPFSKNT
jgi:hypothetical protein